MEGSNTGETVTVWMDLSNHGVFGSHFLEKGNQKADTIRTANYIVIISAGKLSESSKEKFLTLKIYKNAAFSDRILRLYTNPELDINKFRAKFNPDTTRND